MNVGAPGRADDKPGSADDKSGSAEDKSWTADNKPGSTSNHCKASGINDFFFGTIVGAA